MQPTHTRWEQVDPRTYSSAASTTTKTEPQQQPSPPSSESGDAANKPSASSATNLKPLPASIPRNYLVVDTYMAVPGPGVGAAVSARPQPPPPFFPPGTRRMTAAAMAAGDLTSPFTQGLSAVPDEIRALLPPECRAAFDNAVAKEREWSSKWGPEEVVGCRHQPVIDKAIMPGQVGLIGDR